MDSSDSDSDEEDEEKQSGDDSEDSEDDDLDGTNALIKAAQEANARKLKAGRKEKRKAEKAEMLRLAEKRTMKDIKLNQLTSISGSGQGQNRVPSQGRTCYRCGQTGHEKVDCPEGGRSGGLEEAGDMPRSKRLRKA